MKALIITIILMAGIAVASDIVIIAIQEPAVPGQKVRYGKELKKHLKNQDQDVAFVGWEPYVDTNGVTNTVGSFWSEYLQRGGSFTKGRVGQIRAAEAGRGLRIVWTNKVSHRAVLRDWGLTAVTNKP